MMTKQARKVTIESNQYGIRENLLYHIFQPRTKGIVRKDERLIHQLVIPRCHRALIMSQYQIVLAGGAHQGFVDLMPISDLSTISQVCIRMCISMSKLVKTVNEPKGLLTTKPAPLVPIPSTGVFDAWHMDILGPLTPTPQGHKFILLVVDRFSRWCEGFPLKDQQASTIAMTLYREIFTRVWCPRILCF